MATYNPAAYNKTMLTLEEFRTMTGFYDYLECNFERIEQLYINGSQDMTKEEFCKGVAHSFRTSEEATELIMNLNRRIMTLHWEDWDAAEHLEELTRRAGRLNKRLKEAAACASHFAKMCGSHVDTIHKMATAMVTNGLEAEAVEAIGQLRVARIKQQLGKELTEADRQAIMDADDE